MSEARATQFHEELDGQPGPEPLGLAPDPVEVRRNAGLAALVGAIASAVGIAYLWRAVDSSAPLDWLLCLVMGAMAVTFLRSLLDSRTPLLVVIVPAANGHLVWLPLLVGPLYGVAVGTGCREIAARQWSARGPEILLKVSAQP